MKSRDDTKREEEEKNRKQTMEWIIKWEELKVTGNTCQEIVVYIQWVSFIQIDTLHANW